VCDGATDERTKLENQHGEERASFDNSGVFFKFVRIPSRGCAQ
jgi:hypothetical protein